MEPLVFTLVLTAAFSHALWNFFTKKVSGNFAIFWFGCMGANIVLLFYTVYHLAAHGIDFRGFVFILVSAAAHSLYYLSFLYTYARGDISTAYPIARGTGVAGTALISWLFLNEVISAHAGAGIAFVTTGILIIGFSRIRGQKPDIRTCLAAVLTGVFIFTYSLADKRGVQYINPVVYINFTDIIALSLVAPIANRKPLSESWSVVKKHLKETIIIGTGSTGTYLMILFALQLERASYIVSMREFSVVIASIMGFVFLGEKASVHKITGIIMITAGLVLIKLG